MREIGNKREGERRMKYIFFFVPVVVKVGQRHGRGDVHTTLLLLLEVNPIKESKNMIREKKIIYTRGKIYI